MAVTNTARVTLDRGFLEIRSRLLDIAAALDRVDRGEEASAVRGDPRLNQIRQALSILQDGALDRAERVQMAFSLAYDPHWRK